MCAGVESSRRGNFDVSHRSRGGGDGNRAAAGGCAYFEGGECADGVSDEAGAGAEVGAARARGAQRPTINVQRSTSRESGRISDCKAAMGEGDAMVRRTLGKTGLSVSPIAFGAFKIGRNEKIKYAQGYPLPTEEETARLLNGLLDLGINLIDTAPAYGLSEERIGRHISRRRGEFILSTKFGETFENGKS